MQLLTSVSSQEMIFFLKGFDEKHWEDSSSLVFWTPNELVGCSARVQSNDTTRGVLHIHVANLSDIRGFKRIILNIYRIILYIWDLEYELSLFPIAKGK